MHLELFKIGEKIILEKLTGDRYRRMVFGAVYHGEPAGDERIEFYEPSSSLGGAFDGRSLRLTSEDFEIREDGRVTFSLDGDEYALRLMEQSDSVVEENGGFLFEQAPRNDDEEDENEGE